MMVNKAQGKGFNFSNARKLLFFFQREKPKDNFTRNKFSNKKIMFFCLILVENNKVYIII